MMKRAIFFSLTFGLCLSPIIAQAQVTPDNTLGRESSQVNNVSDPNTQQIDGGAIRGENLFHSFQEFNINEGNTVNFSNPQGINHIFSRVTGNNPSNILGKLGVNGNADLFFLNPNGIIFGANSSLNVNGSFLGTSASSIDFADGTKFSAINTSNQPLLTISRPIGLSFEQQPGTIINQSLYSFNPNRPSVGLTINPGKTLALIGGDILFEAGFITSFGGRIELASAAADDFIGLSEINDQWILGYDGLKQGQNIRLTKGFDLKKNITTGSFILAFSENGNMVDVELFGRNIILDDVEIASVSLDGTPTGNLTITALDTIELRNDRFDEQDQFPEKSTLGIVSGNNTQNAGEILIDTQKLIVGKGGQITGSSFITINPETGEVLGAFDGTNIKINASESLEIRDGGVIKTNSITDNDSSNINITSPKVIVRNQGKITAEATFFEILTTGEIITGTGEGGSINIVSDSLEVTDNGSISSSAVSSGNGGNINISTQDLTLQNDGEITVESTGTGEAGNIEITAQSLFLDNNSSLAAKTTQSDGGNINLAVSGNIILENQSNITASVGEAGNGGDININTEFLIANPQENSDISANAEAGNGGNITIEATDVIGIQFRTEQTPLSDITAISESGVDGTVTIIRPESKIIQYLNEADPNLIDAGDTLENAYCKAIINSRFVITGRGGLPRTPEEEPLPTNIWEDWRVFNDEELQNNPVIANSQLIPLSAKDTKSPEITPIHGWYVNEKGETVLTAEPIMLTPQGITTPIPGCN